MNNIIILNKSGVGRDAEKADSETLLILLMLRTIFKEDELEVPPKLIAEVADSQNQVLVTNNGVRDFIISNRLVSMLIAQVSEEADVNDVYENLFAEDGSEIYIKPLSLYLGQDEVPNVMTFADCMQLAQQRGEVCIGLKVASEEADQEANFGIKLIPKKKEKFQLTLADSLIVVAEDEC